MRSEHVFDQDEDEDFTNNFTASPEEDYVTLFMYPKGPAKDPFALGKNAAKAIVSLFPYNFTKPTYRSNLTANGKNIILKLEYSPAKRIPLEPKHQTINRYTMVRLGKQEGFPDCLLTQEPVANGNYSNSVGEFKTKSANNLTEEEMNTLTHIIEDLLLKQALASVKSKDWASKKLEKNKKLMEERQEKERKDTPSSEEGKLIPQIGLSKYEQDMGLKRRRGSIVIMVAGEEDVDYYENAYESLAETVTIKADLGNNNIITLTMGNKEERAQRDMLTQEENEVQDNIQVIKENRYQVKIISYNGYAEDTKDKYKQETNLHLHQNGGTLNDGVKEIEHHTVNAGGGDMEIYIITVTTHKDRDLILGLEKDTSMLRYTKETARGLNLKYGRQALFHLGQLMDKGQRISFKAKGGGSGMNSNPRYMKAWSIAANVMKDQGNDLDLNKFWPLVNSQAIINLHSPNKKGKEKAVFLGIEESIQVEEQEEWQIRTPWKANEDSTISNARMEALEKSQQSTTTIVESLSTELSKTRMECNEVLVKAKEAIDSSKRAVDALLQHLQALDKEIKAYDKTVKDSEQATKYLGGQVQNIAGQISQLENVPDVQMQAMQKVLAETMKMMKEQQEVAKINKEALEKARTERQEAGKESALAQAKLLELTSEGNAPRQILMNNEQQQQEESNTGGGPSGNPSTMENSPQVNDPNGALLKPKDLLKDMTESNMEMDDVGSKRPREESEEGQVQAKRSNTPLQDAHQNDNEGTATDKGQALDEQEEDAMQQAL